jgi:hypothetical protein
MCSTEPDVHVHPSSLHVVKHNGAVLPLPSAPEGRGADGVDAMA